jgi:hypothetical protein
LLTIILALALALHGTARSPQQRPGDSRTWYQAYDDGMRAIQQRNWQAVVDNMEAAKRAGAPKPGRKIPFVGDRYADFIPDYYLGIAYLNLKRYAESEKAFESVRASGLIGQRDPEYAQFQTQFNTARSSALQALGKVDVPVTNDPRAKADVNEPKISPPTVGAPVSGDPRDGIVTAGQPPPAQAPQQPLAQATPSSVQSAQSLAVANAKTPPFGPTNKTTPPNTRGNAANSRTPAPSLPSNAITARAVSPLVEQQAVSAYLAGRYDQTAAMLASVASGTGFSPRAYFYLACSRTALAASGQADPASIADARALLARAGDQAQFSADKRYISPRVLQMLGVKP